LESYGITPTSDRIKAVVSMKTEGIFLQVEELEPRQAGAQGAKIVERVLGLAAG
jgi:hypothetical protein